MWRPRTRVQGQRTKAELRHLKRRAREGDADSALALLEHSVALGHSSLSVERFVYAQRLAADGLERFRPFCERAAAELGSPLPANSGSKSGDQSLSDRRGRS